MPAGRTHLVCDTISFNRKTWKVRTMKCHVTREGNGKSFEAKLSSRALAHKRAMKAKRSKQAKARLAKTPKVENPWKCKSTRVEGKNVIGTNCSRMQTMGFGGQKRQTVKRIVLSKGGR